jgi:4-amino-4-deoxy-L-arabinose transferase-like glycosyltransferase
MGGPGQDIDTGGRRRGGSSWTMTAGVAAVALVPRLWHLAEFARLPWFRVLQMDAKFHAEWARQLLDGHWNDPQVYFRAPVYPYFLALLQSITGEILWSARAVQIVLGIATVVFVHRIALRVLPGRWGLAAGLLAALAWVPIQYETELLLEPLVTFLTTLVLFLAVRAERQPGIPALLCWGGLVGLASATRPNALVLLPLLPVYAVALAVAAPGIARGGTGEPQRRGRAAAGALAGGGASGPAGRGTRAIRASWVSALPRPIVFVLLGFLVPTLPVWIHNARQGDPATLLAWQGGINLYLGNNPDANGWSAIGPGMRTDWRGGFDDAVRIAVERSGGRTLRPSGISDFWVREAGRFWQREPGRALRLTATKMLLFWGNAEIKNNEDPRFLRMTMASLRWLPVSFGLLAPFALVGLFLARRAGPRFGLLAAFTVAWFLSIVPFFVCARYRLPVTPLLPLFALLTVRTGVGWWRERRWAALLPAGAVVLGLFPLLHAPRAGVDSGGFFQAWRNLGDAYSELRDWSAAADAFRQSLALNPRYVASWNNLGLALQELGRLDEAERAFRGGLAIEPEHPTLRQNLGIVLTAEGRNAQAEEVYRGILRDYPQGWDTGLLLAGVLEAQGRREEAAATCRMSLARDPRLAPVRARLVALLLALGRPAEADSILRDGKP